MKAILILISVVALFCLLAWFVIQIGNAGLDTTVFIIILGIVFVVTIRALCGFGK